MELSKTTFSLLFFIRKDRVKKSTGKAPINCRITINGEIVNFNIHYDVDPNIWDAEANRARSKTEEALKLNQSLDNYQASIISKYREMIERDNLLLLKK